MSDPNPPRPLEALLAAVERYFVQRGHDDANLKAAALAYFAAPYSERLELRELETRQAHAERLHRHAAYWRRQATTTNTVKESVACIRRSRLLFEAAHLLVRDEEPPTEPTESEATDE